MNTTTIKLTSLALFLTMLFSSCATTKDGRLTQGQGAVGGAVAGALLGALVGAATGNYNQAAQFAAIGAGAGAIAGFAYGSHVAKKKAQYAKQEDFLDFAVAQAEKNNAEAVAANQKLAGEVQRLEQSSKSVPDAKTKKTWMNESQIQLGAIDKQTKKIDAQIQDYNECLTGNGYGNKSQSSVLRSKIRGLETQKASMLKYKTRLASAQTRIAI